MEFNQLDTNQTESFVELRGKPRFQLETEITISSHTVGVLKGQTVDISETGVAAILRMELPLNEVVQLEFTLPDGLVELEALVRQRNAFRYGFQFVEQGPARELIARTCRRLAVAHTCQSDP